MNSVFVWLGTLAAPPLLLVAATQRPIELRRLRRLALAAASSLLAISLLPAFSAQLRGFTLGFGRGGELLRVNALSSALLPLAAGLWLLTVAVTPHAALDRGGLRRSALATLVTLVTFLTTSAGALFLLQAAALGIFLWALRDPVHGYQRRIAMGWLGASVALLGAGAALLAWGGSLGSAGAAAVWLITIAALLRNGVVPFHAWMPEMFDQGRLGPTILYSAPQVGAYLIAVLVAPHAPRGLLHVAAALGLVTAVYGAALAVAQASARRACGYLFMSQSALVVVGLDCASVTALAGGLVIWLSSGLAFAGLARIVQVLEARRGRLDLRKYHGGYERAPLLAASFLVLGLACTGFPGTLGFVGEDLLLRGTVESFPLMGYALVAASALTGVALLRMYFSLFCGRREPRLHAGMGLELKRRDVVAFAALVATLVALGLAPRRLVESRLRAGTEILTLTGAGSGRGAAINRGR